LLVCKITKNKKTKKKYKTTKLQEKKIIKRQETLCGFRLTYFLQRILTFHKRKTRKKRDKKKHTKTYTKKKKKVVRNKKIL